MSAASDLIDHLKVIADAAIQKAEKGANSIAAAPYSGQKDIYSRQLGAPDNITGWERTRTQPTMPTLPALPALPSDMKVDYAGISALVTADVSKLQTSWMAKFLPSDTDVSALNNLFKDVLGGSAADAATLKLDALALNLTSVLSSLTANVQTGINASILTYQTNLGANLTTSRNGVAAGLAIAGDGTQNVAWVNARDQAVREANRKSRETISKWASRGFTLPNGALVKQIARDQQSVLDTTSEIAAQQAIKTQQLYFDTAMKSVDTYLRFMEVQAQNELAALSTQLNANLRYAELSLDANKYNAKIAFDNLGLRIDFTKFAATTAVQYRLGVNTAMNGLIAAYATLVRNESEYLSTIASAQRATQLALVEYFRAAMQYSDMSLKADLANLEKNSKYVDTAARFIGDSVGHQIQAAGAFADLYSRTAGMALSGLNGVASVAEQLTR